MVLTSHCHPPGLAQWCTPEWVVISGGDEAESADAARTYQAAGADVLHCSTLGTVRFRIGRDGMSLEHWQAGAWRELSRR